MHILYKLIALSVVFGLVVADPIPKMSSPRFDEIAYDTPYDIFEVNHEERVPISDIVEDKSVSVISIVGIISKLIGLKGKALALAVVAIKWLAPKAVFLAIGAIGTLGFCFLTSKCSLAYDPVVYQYVPVQVRDLVTPERLQDAQQFLYSAMQQYAQENASSAKRS